MSSEVIKKGIHWIGVKDEDLRVFDIIMETKRGTTYNSYIIDDEKVAIIDICKDGFYETYKNNIEEVIGDKKVDYIVVQHTELDHAGALKNLVEDYPEATVVGTKMAINYLKEILNKPFKSMEAKGTLNLGRNSLEFIIAPCLHWPDTMFSYNKENEVLFTCDFTGCHYCPNESILMEGGDDYEVEMKYYFDCIMGPFKPFVNAGLKKIEDLKIEYLCPSHGPIHKGANVSKYLDKYKEWATINEVDKNKVEIFYITAYGNTGEMAKYLKDKLIDAGYKADVHEITELGLEKCVELIDKAGAFMIGSPTINGDAVKPAWDLLSLVCVPVNKGKVACAFGSYGWSGEGVPMLTSRLKSLKLKVVEEGIPFKFVPSKDEFSTANAILDKFISML